MSRQIILDTETTGLSPEQGHRIIEVGCIEMVNRQVTDCHFHRYVNPERDIERGAEEVHGITAEFLQDKPYFCDIIAELIQFIDGAELIIHNAPFDVGFLNHEFQLVGKPYKKVTDYCGIIDTLVLARHKHPGQHNNLNALCKRYYVDNSNRELHGALIDADLLARVYLAMTSGQTQLFADTEEQKNHADTEAIQHQKVLKEHALPVIVASAEELAAHEAFLNILREKGLCAWDE